MHPVSLNDLSFKKICTLTILPLLFLALCILVVNIIYQKQYTTLLAKTYYIEAQIFSSDTEEKLQNVILSAKSLENNKNFYNAINERSGSTNNAALAVTPLKDFVNAKQLIHSAAILDFSSNTAVTNTGTYDMQEYLGSFSSYNSEFWYNYEPIYNRVQILSPESLHISDIETPVITIALSPWGSISSKNVFIININIHMLLRNLNNYILTPNTQLFIYDKPGSRLFSSDNNQNNDFMTSISNSEVLRNIKKKNANVHSQAINGKDYLFIASETGKSSQNYSYIIAVPYHDIYDAFPPLHFHFIMIILLFFSITLITSYKNAKAIYTPISKIEQTLSKTLLKITQQDTLKSNNIEDAFNEAVTTQENYNIALSILKENFLSDILFQSNKSNIFDKNQETFFHNKISFRYSLFTVVALKFEITAPYQGNTFSKNLNDELHKTTSQLFTQNFDSYLIKEPKKDRYYIIVNFDNEREQKLILQKLSALKCSFDSNNDYIKLLYGISEPCTEIEDIRYAYNVAKNILMSQIDNDVSSPDMTISINDENLLYNYLMSGHINNAQSLIFKFIDHFENSSETEKFRCYTIIVSTIFKVMYAKNIAYSTDKDISEADAIASIILYPGTEFKQFINECLTKIQERFQTNESKLNIQEVIEYINQNYSSILSLEILADKYATNPSYLSRRIKQYIGTNFSNYLSNIRVNHAKKLLSDTNLPIKDIIEETGFISRSSFLRVFKTTCGITPSEYRDITNNNAAVTHQNDID